MAGPGDRSGGAAAPSPRDPPARARAVVVGGGVVGCGVAYHLGKRGVETVLFERKRLTCGTTWHAAGLVGQLRGKSNLARLVRYSAELYDRIGDETGQDTGHRRTGSVAVASDADRLTELKRNMSLARRFGLEAELLDPGGIRGLCPYLRTEDLVGGVHLPSDGQCDPVGISMALATGAKQAGVRIFEDLAVRRVLVDGGRAVGVETERGECAADQVVLCAGMWTRDLAAAAGVSVPLHAAEHFYIVTEPLEGLPADLPSVRDQSSHIYFKEDAGKILVGCFEPEAKPWGMGGIPEDFAFDSLPMDMEHFEPILEKMVWRFPGLETAGVRLFFSGPESFTPDDNFLVGETPEVDGLFVAAGFNSIGIQSAGGVGRLLADWMVDGEPPQDFEDVRVDRLHPFQSNRLYLRERTAETLGLLYAMHWPHRQKESARDVRRSPLHAALAGANACFGEAAGWERPNWFAPPGAEPRYGYSFGRQNWFDRCAGECLAMRDRVGLADLSSFAKIAVKGADACAALGRVCANDIDVAPGRVVYTQWLNAHGGIVADVTVTRVAEDEFLVISGVGSQVRDQAWLRRHLPGDARCETFDATSALALVAVMGPRARQLLASVGPDDWADERLRAPGASRAVELGRATVRASRVSYVGEPGWELCVPAEFAAALFDRLVEAGQELGCAHVGFHAIDSMRLEKARRHFGHDITPEDTPLQAGLGFAVAYDKKGGFVGRDALLRAREQKADRRLALFAVADDLLVHGEEPVFRDGSLAGGITSGAHGHRTGRSLGFAHVGLDGADTLADIRDAGWEVEIAGERVPLEMVPRMAYDPKNLRLKE